jgi:DNA-binding transcriptional MerR regulator
MTDSLDIAQVAKLTGLTSRALRFYEARGLVKPLRSASGRRHYGPAELERLHQILALKRAGLSLAQIEKLTAGRKLDLRALVSAQIKTLETQQRDLAKAKTLLTAILSRIDRSEPIDVATFCSLIRQGELTMSQEIGAEIRARYMTPEQMDEYETLSENLAPGFDQQTFNAKWKDLTERIRAALPMDPASTQGQAFLDEWQGLVQPWIEAASPTMREGFRNLYSHFDEWQGEVESRWDPDVFRFHQDAARARGDAGTVRRGGGGESQNAGRFRPADQ